MSNYQLGKIYKLQHREKADLFYIGSTATTLQERLRCHIKKSEIKKYKIYKIIEEDGGWENFEMILIKEYACNDKEELRQEEQRCIDAFNPTMNDHRAYTSTEDKKKYEKEWYEANKERLIKYRKEHYGLNKEYFKQYNIDNKEKRSKQYKEYYDANRERLIEYQKERKKIEITCECGRVIKKAVESRHRKSAIHIKLMNKNLTDI